MVAKIGAKPNVKQLKVACWPILSDITGQISRPPRLPPASTKRYDDANEEVTMEGIELENTSLIIGLATDINPMPPVIKSVEVENNNQN